MARAVSCKVTLAARVDSFHESADGKTGRFLLGEIERRLEKLQEPPPVKAVKPLAPPIDPGKTKRGGRRARKMKERLGMTELSRQKNRMIFGEVRSFTSLFILIDEDFFFRLKKMPIKMQWAFPMARSVNLVRAEFVPHKSIRKPKQKFLRNFK